MLYIVRKLEEAIVIDNNIVVKVVEIKNNKVKLGIEFPPSSLVLRKEVHDKMSKENIEALRSFVDLEIEDIEAIDG